MGWFNHQLVNHLLTGMILHSPYKPTEELTAEGLHSASGELDARHRVPLSLGSRNPNLAKRPLDFKGTHTPPNTTP